MLDGQGMFRTYDLPLAAYLEEQGLMMHCVLHEGRGRGVFEFFDEPGREKLTNDWYSGQDPVASASAFWQRVRLLKRRIEMEIVNNPMAKAGDFVPDAAR